MWIVGQRVLSQTEPELGLGMVVKVSQEGRILVAFETAGLKRVYAAKNPPIRRMILSVGQTAQFRSGQKFVVKEIRELEGLVFYRGEQVEGLEPELDPSSSDLGTLDLFLSGQWSRPEAFDLRLEGWTLLETSLDPEIRGLVGPRVEPLSHQLFIARQVCSRPRARAILADEVGLGKTIEAGLIFSSLRALGRAPKTLVVVPEALKHQWLTELYRRFNTLFSIVDEERCLEEESTTPGATAFSMNADIICSLDFLLGNPHRLEQAQAENWSLVIVDEAHHLSLVGKNPSPGWSAVNSLTRPESGLLLLTATPKQRGLENQFALLHLIDPDRFPDFEKFRIESSHMKECADLAQALLSGTVKAETLARARQLFKGDAALEAEIELFESSGNADRIVASLVDRHGTGRVFFRNRRERLKGFKTRILKASPLESAAPKPTPAQLKEISAVNDDTLLAWCCGRAGPDGASLFVESWQKRADWLIGALSQLGSEKLLIMCHRASDVKRLDEFLQKNSGHKRALFHEGMDIVERDRQAAWFADPKGAQILVTSEIGGEGRNFQFCHHLLFFDLPQHPDLVEQRIGRLDRIGQKNDIKVFVPFLRDTPEEVLFEWYRAGLGSFERAWNGAAPLLDALKHEILRVARAFLPQSAELEERWDLLDALIERTHAEVKLHQKDQQENVDVLVDFNSFQESVGHRLRDRVRERDDNPDVQNFMEEVFDHYGLDTEDFDTEGSLKINAGSMMTIESFPEINNEDDKVISFRRDVALRREDLSFLTFDHPMVQGALSLLLDRGEGRSCVASFQRAPDELKGQGALLDLVYVLQATAVEGLEVERYLRPALFRRGVSLTGKTFDVEQLIAKHPWKSLTEDGAIRAALPKLRDPLIKILTRVERELDSNVQQLKQVALKTARADQANEQGRLRQFGQKDVEFWQHRFEKMTHAIDRAQLRLEAIRLITF